MKETKLWTWHLLAGAAILFLGGLHMMVIHWDGLLGLFNPAGGSALDWGNVAARSRDVFFVVVYILLLGVTMFHGLYGLRNIIFETGLGKGGRNILNVTLVIGGLALFVYGTWAVIAAQAV